MARSKASTVGVRRRSALACICLVGLMACGGDGGTPSTPTQTSFGTLAYVDTSCEESSGRFTASQSLRVLHGESERSVLDLSFPEVSAGGQCTFFGTYRDGNGSLAFGALNRLGITPDGTHLLYEVTDDFSGFYAGRLESRVEGIFIVDTAGGEPRRLADASRFAHFTRGSADPGYRFSPDSKRAVYIDRGPGPDGIEVAQVFILELESGLRTQITHLERAAYRCCVGFLNRNRILFHEEGPAAEDRILLVDADGGDLELVPPLSSSSGGIVVPSFQIGSHAHGATFGFLDVPPVNPSSGFRTREVFVFDDATTLQITDFHRIDTALIAPLVSVDEERVFFTASDPAGGENSSEVCQIFSAAALGGDVHPITHFSYPNTNRSGCLLGEVGGCSTNFGFGGPDSQDARSGTLIFDTTCDPFGDTPIGEQLYAIEPDGSGLRQLTHTKGTQIAANHTTAELPGPWSYGPHP